MIVLENPEFPDNLHPKELDADLLKKYSVGEVIVHPRISYMDGAQTIFMLFPVFLSKANTPVVLIKTVTLKVNGVELEYGEQIINGSSSEWRLAPINEPFYVSSISGGPIDRPKEEMIKARVDVSLEVSVKEENGKVTEKIIDVYFLPKKRAFLE